MGKRMNLDLLKARFVLGVATPEQTDVVVGLLEADCSHAVADGLPSPEQAAWTLLETHIGAIARGTVRPERGVGLVIDEVFRCPGLLPKPGRAMGESHDAERLVALQDEYDDVRRRQRETLSAVVRTPQIDAQIVLEAKQWMERNATGRV